MRLNEVIIYDYKNLHNLQVNFDGESPYTVLIGQNGSGKSNFIEALTYIFRNLDLDIEAPFSYDLKYRCRENDVEVHAKKNEVPRFRVRQMNEAEYQELPRRRFMDVDEEDRPLYRPAFIFGYYSGPSDRMAALFDRHRERFYRFIIQPRSSRERKKVNSNALRRLFYAQTVHGQFALLSFFMQPPHDDDDDRAFLREHLQIDGLDSVLFALKRPNWRSPGGDPRFWNAEGEVRDFLSHLYDAAMLPMRMNRRITIDVAKNLAVEHLYLFLPNPEALEAVYKRYDNQYAFFTALESTYISNVLGEVRTRVRMTPTSGGGEVTYRDLSEGEQQLLLVLGLLKFTAEDETIFLLDEPDTHLNPAWSTQYLDFLNRFIRRPQSCHILMSTHDPLVFSRLTRSEVQIMRRDINGRVMVEIPEQDPRGMGVDAILTSDLFRLRTALDLPTQAALDQWRRLTMKTEPLSEAESDELRRLNKQLRGLALTQTIRDPLYQQFLKAWTEQEDPSWYETVELTSEQRDARDRLAEKILDELAGE